jgi:hypothetical protein
MIGEIDGGWCDSYQSVHHKWSSTDSSGTLQGANTVGRSVQETTTTPANLPRLTDLSHQSDHGRSGDQAGKLTLFGHTKRQTEAFLFFPCFVLFFSE